MLYILDYAADRPVLDKELGHPSKPLLLVRGNDAGVGGFVQRADQAAMVHGPWRTIVWLRTPLLGPQEENHFFGAGREAIAVMLDLADNIVCHFGGNEPMWQIDAAFEKAEGRP